MKVSEGHNECAVGRNAFWPTPFRLGRTSFILDADRHKQQAVLRVLGDLVGEFVGFVRHVLFGRGTHLVPFGHHNLLQIDQNDTCPVLLIGLLCAARRGLLVFISDNYCTPK